MAKTRIFNGKRYTRWQTWTFRHEAEKQAKSMKDVGYASSTRIIKAKKGNHGWYYDVYYRKARQK